MVEKSPFFGAGPQKAFTMVNQIEFDPSRLSHFTSPVERAKSAEKFRASPPRVPLDALSRLRPKIVHSKDSKLHTFQF